MRESLLGLSRIVTPTIAACTVTTRDYSLVFRRGRVSRVRVERAQAVRAIRFQGRVLVAVIVYIWRVDLKWQQKVVRDLRACEETSVQVGCRFGGADTA